MFLLRQPFKNVTHHKNALVPFLVIVSATMVCLAIAIFTSSSSIGSASSTPLKFQAFVTLPGLN
jgi:hypothetical protein